MIPAVDDVSTIAPPRPRLMISGITYLHARNEPVRLTARMACQSSSSMFQVSRVIGMAPCWATRKSMPPKASTVWRTASRTGRAVAHVDHDGEHLAAEVLHEADGLVEVVTRRHAVGRVRGRAVGDVPHGDPGALPGQGQRVAAALTAGATR